MWINGRIAPGRKSVHHGCTPRVATKEPVEIGLLQFAVLLITGKLLVPITLNGKGCREVIAAPDIGDTTEEGIGPGFVPYFFNTGFLKADQRIIPGTGIFPDNS